MKGYLLIRVGEERLGLRLQDVRQVADRGEVAAAPGAHPAVLGVTRLGTQLVPLVDLGQLLHLTDRSPRPCDTVVLALCGGKPVAFQVDGADAVVRQAPEPAPGAWRLPWASGVARSPEGLIPIVDMAALAERLMAADVGERV